MENAIEKIIFPLVSVGLSACIADGNSVPSYSFDEVVERRLNDDLSLDGEEV